MEFNNHHSIPPTQGVLEKIENNYNNVSRTKYRQKWSTI